MHLHHCLCPCPSWAALHRAVPRPSLGQEGQPIRLWVASRVRVSPAPSFHRRLSMMCHPMGFQRSCRHLLPTFIALYPFLLPLPEDDGGGTDIPGAAEGASRVQGMQEGDGGGIAGIPPNDTAWTGEGGTLELGCLSHGRRPTDISAGLPDQGRAAELPCRGMPRKGSDTDSDADAFMQPVYPVHRDHLGGGKPPTPKVLTMRNAGPTAGAQR